MQARSETIGIAMGFLLHKLGFGALTTMVKPNPLISGTAPQSIIQYIEGLSLFNGKVVPQFLSQVCCK